MKSTLIIQTLYSISGVIVVLFYLPQLVTVVRAKSNLKDVSLASWGVWAICIFNSSLYGHYVVADNIFALFSLASSGCCFVIFGITAVKRVKYNYAPETVKSDDEHFYKKFNT